MFASWQESDVKPRQCVESRGITLPTKVCIVKAMVFPIVMYDCESWTVEKAECQRIDAFKLWCWRRLLKVPWTPRRSNQSILKEINHEYLLEGLMLQVKLQYFGDLMPTDDSLEKSLMLRKTEGRRIRRHQRMRWLSLIHERIWFWANSRRLWGTGKPGVLQSLGLQRVGYDWSTEQWQIICLWDFSSSLA